MDIIIFIESEQIKYSTKTKLNKYEMNHLICISKTHKEINNFYYFLSIEMLYMLQVN